MNKRSSEEQAALVAERLRSLRIEHGYTQSQMADFLEIKQAVYSHYENGKRQLPLTVLVMICDFYSVSPEFVLNIPEIQSKYSKEINTILETAKSLEKSNQIELMNYAKFLYEKQGRKE